MEISSEILEAYLKCPTKCWLRASGEQFAGNTYAHWARTHSDTYCAINLKRLEANSPSGQLVVSPPTTTILSATWRYATRISVRVATNTLALRSELHALERQPTRTNGESAGIVPIRFVFTNKLGQDERILLGLDALVLSKSLGHNIEIGKIIHGDHGVTTQLGLAAVVGDTQKYIDNISALLSSSSPPELVLNRHCPACEFQNRCRQKATAIDELSLLSGMSEKERTRHRSKGIFTVTQLSYTFRPRRTPKRAKNPAKPHHYSLQALAIREKCVYIHGTPLIPSSTHQVYLDIEGLPDRDFYYLIGALVVSENDEAFYSFWADTESDSTTMFLQFADLIAELPDCRIFHYGGYDAAAMKRVAVGLPREAQEQFDRILLNSVNVLSLVFPHVYFPTYSNGLKEISQFLDSNYGSRGVTGLDSIVWRMQWESTKDASLKKLLVEYNQSDCIALKCITKFIANRISDGVTKEHNAIPVSLTEDMTQVRPYWQLFAVKPYAIADLEYISKSAYFDYQREKVFIRTHPHFKTINRRTETKKGSLSARPNITTYIEAKACAYCKSKNLNRDAESGHVVVDLKFSQSGVRKCVTRLVSWRYNCQNCGRSFRSESRLPNPRRLGHALVSWCVYQNAVLGVNMSKVRKSLADVFGLHVDKNLGKCKVLIANFYEPLYAEILADIIKSQVIHIDETTVSLRKQKGYVWVLTTFDRVYYFYRPTRETEFLHAMLATFEGVLVSDFYSGYDSLPCAQQKCIVHLVRDIDDDLLRNPFDEELKRLAQAFGVLLRLIISTVDRFGLKRRHLNKHKRDAEKFLRDEVSLEFTSELAKKYAKRFSKYGARMFTFLDYDGVPWNNNNAEHAIKRFAKYRRDNDGRHSERTLKDYLVLASTFETCEFNKVNVLKWLLSKEQTLDGLLRMAGQKRALGESSLTGTNSQPPLH